MDCLCYLCLVFVMLSRLALVCDVYCDFVTFPFGIFGACVVLDCIDSWSLLSFLLLLKIQLKF